MKKVILITVLAVGSIALAASINVPWFADNAPAHSGGNPTSGMLGLVALHNNLDEDITCGITYYGDDGTAVTGTNDPADTRLFVWASNSAPEPYNTFVIAPNATLEFRPVRDDPSPACEGVHPDYTLTLGQEGPMGVLVPNRPMYGTGSTSKKNGSLVIEWVTDPVEGTPNASSVQGRYSTTSTAGNAMYLLPSGS